MKIPQLATSRLTLRAFTDDDVVPFHRMLIEKDVLRYFPNTDPPSLERVQKMVSGILKHWAEHGFGLWAVERRQSGEFMGRCGLQVIPDTGEVEVDFILGKAFWGQGYATEGGQASVQYGFERLGVEMIVGIVHPENMASQRVLEKLGLVFREKTQYFGMDCFRYAVENQVEP